MHCIPIVKIRTVSSHKSPLEKLRVFRDMEAKQLLFILCSLKEIKLAAYVHSFVAGKH